MTKFSRTLPALLSLIAVAGLLSTGCNKSHDREIKLLMDARFAAMELKDISKYGATISDTYFANDLGKRALLYRISQVFANYKDIRMTLMRRQIVYHDDGTATVVQKYHMTMINNTTQKFHEFEGEEKIHVIREDGRWLISSGL